MATTLAAENPQFLSSPYLNVPTSLPSLLGRSYRLESDRFSTNVIRNDDDTTVARIHHPLRQVEITDETEDGLGILLSAAYNLSPDHASDYAVV